MKKITVLVAIICFVGCKNNQETPIIVEETPEYAVFGDSITAEGVLSKEELLEKYANLQEGDTLAVKFTSTIQSVCQKKGCWMNVALDENNVAFIKFKDYGFFVPKNAADKEVIVNGKAFVSVESVEELKHYAKDAGKSEAAIDSITEPEITYSFMADGVLIKK